jgi:hypothetical protein
MLWKILSALSAICLAVGVWFSYQNKSVLEEERRLKERSEQNLKAVRADQVKKTDAKGKRTKELEDYTKQRDDRRVEVAKVNSDIADKQKETEELKKTLEEAQKQLALIKEQIAKAGDLKKLIAEVEDLNRQIKESEAAIANQEQQKAIVEGKLAATNAQVKKLQEVDTRQRRGQIEPGLTARVSQTFQGYGFVVLNKGNSSGVYANNMLDVKRGKTVVAKLRVRDVEQTQSVADLVPGSLASGESIQPGDLVAPGAPPAAPATTPHAPAPTTPPAMEGGGAPAVPAVAPDPFATAPGEPAKPAAADPFAPAPQ